MRHRLDSEGNRYGKVIEYRVSELRAVDLLDDLCKVASDYSLVTLNSTAGRRSVKWVRVKGGGVSGDVPGKRPSSAEEAQRTRELASYCGRLLETHEDEIVEAIISGRIQRSSAPAYVCGALRKACRLAPPAAAEAGGENEGGEDPAVGDEDVQVSEDDIAGDEDEAPAAGGDMNLGKLSDEDLTALGINKDDVPPLDEL